MKKTIDDCFFQIQNGANIKQGDVDGGFPITRIETTANNKFNRDRMGYAGITDISKYESYVLEDGDLLMSHINSVQYLGRTVLYVKQTDETIIHGMNLLRLKARRDVINPAYARYCFYGSPFRRQVRKITKKSVNQASFAVKDLKQIKIDVPSLSEQEQIVEVLDKLQKIIEIRSNELSTLDNLIKARFVEMFGDPVLASKEEKVELMEVCEKITDGEHGSVTRITDGHPFLNAKHILKNGNIDWDTVTFIGDTDHQKIYKRCNPEKGDILLTTTGTIGNVAILPECEEVSMDRGITLLKINRKKVTSEFVAEMLKQESIQIQMGANVHASAIGHLFMNKVKKLPVILPNIERQIEFTKFVKQVNKSKVAVQKSLDETQKLFDSLMQQYFG